jgi:hypothetical protein
MGDMSTAVAIGALPGYESYRKFGMNNAIGVGEEEMWPAGILRVLPTSAGALSVVSDDPTDDVGNTGATSITVEGLDSNYEDISEVIAMDGATPAASVSSDWYRVNRAYNTEAGTNEINAGNISISIGGDVQAYIEANQGQTHQTHYTVPAGKTLLVTGYFIGVGRMGGNTDLHILAQIKLFGTTAWRSISDIWLWNGANHQNAGDTVTVVPEKTEIRQRIISTVTTQAHGIYQGYLVDNEIGI